MSRRKANAGWTGYVGYKQVPPAEPTEFDKQVRRLHLKPEGYAHSLPLRNWVYHNYNRYYVPEKLLESLGIFVDV
jgi:hypothetical protein